MSLTKATYSMIDGIFLNVNDYGADPTGIADSTTAIQAAIDAATATNRRVVGIGTYKISSKVVIKCNADFSQAIFNVYNTPGIAVEISTGNATDPTTILMDATIWLPKEINNMTKPSVGWAGQGYGVRVVNAYTCQIFVGRIHGFSRGLFLTSNNSHGSVYSNYYLGFLDNNEQNLVLSPLESTSWTNENNFYGGRFFHESSEGTNVSGCFHIHIALAASISNNNVFYKPSIEGDVPQYHFLCAGGYNTIIQGRWEASPPKVAYQYDNPSAATSNVIFEGYNAQNIQFTFFGTGGGGNLNHMVSDRLEYHTTSSGRKITNQSSSGDPIDTYYEAGTRPETAGASEWSVKHSAQDLQGKQKTDTYARLKLDYTNGLVAVGNGTVAPTNGATGTFTAGTKTVTVVGGIITSIV